ncbi:MULTISPECIES: chaplin family protein [unclassified Streptomyces]|uniref:chaplin n=1 Tax=unclassified Streptomyces TaxID=2593676 RepID=UPI002DD9A0FE|nr:MULTISPECIES: chaplin family protein [unclassified Streptomyces]
MRQGTRKGLITIVAAGGVLAMSGGTAFADSNAQGSSGNSPGVLSGNTFQAPVDVTVNICGNTASAVGLLNPASGASCGNSGPGAGTSHEGGGHSPQGGHSARADGASHGSPGVGSGNDVQVPVDIPVNVCGDSVNVVGIGNGVQGNGCEAPSAGEPDGPGHPEEPGRPGEPENPGDPGDPGDPGGPGEPGDPGSPSEPPGDGTPSHPGGPEQPGTPGQEPGQPGTDGVIHAGSQPEAGPVSASSVPVADSRRPGSGQEAPGGELAQTGGGSPLGVVAPLSAGMILGGYVLYRRSRAAVRP